jgi:hypothetical protein
MYQHEPQDIPRTAPRVRYLASLRVFATACFMMQAVGCAYQATEQTPSPHKSPTAEKPAPPGSAQPSRIEQSDKAKTVEKKSPAAKEKKSTAATDKTPGKKLDQPEESATDTFAPPPPLKPPTFGGAGG